MISLLNGGVGVGAVPEQGSAVQLFSTQFASRHTLLHLPLFFLTPRAGENDEHDFDLVYTLNKNVTCSLLV